VAKKALIVWGGWDGHQPKEVGELFANVLKEEGFEVEVSDTLDAYNDGEKLKQLNLIVPIWTMGMIEPEQEQNVLAAVESGVGLAGCHGGMCDSFRNSTGWQWMTGGQWVAHPGNDGTNYRVVITDKSSPLTEGISDFDVSSEQYYMHVDPAVKVLAVTPMPVAEGPHSTNGEFNMPVVWTKYYGQGRVYYNSLGHQANVFDIPEALELMRRGFNWAARD
jgi:type 1 glutamine amidotransferase